MRLDQRVPAPFLALAGAFVLLAGWMLQSWLEASARLVAADAEAAAVAREDQEQEIAEMKAWLAAHP